MRRLPLEEFDIRNYLLFLDRFIVQHPALFQSKSDTWHSQLAKALLPVVRKPDLGQKRFIKGMCILPLNTGKWTSLAKDSVFSMKTGGFRIPSSIALPVIDSQAENDTFRFELYWLLGVKDCDVFDICRLVVDTHRPKSFQPQSVP